MVNTKRTLTNAEIRELRRGRLFNVAFTNAELRRAMSSKKTLFKREPSMSSFEAESAGSMNTHCYFEGTNRSGVICHDTSLRSATAMLENILMKPRGEDGKVGETEEESRGNFEWYNTNNNNSVTTPDMLLSSDMKCATFANTLQGEKRGDIGTDHKKSPLLRLKRKMRYLKLPVRETRKQMNSKPTLDSRQRRQGSGSSDGETQKPDNRNDNGVDKQAGPGLPLPATGTCPMLIQLQDLNPFSPPSGSSGKGEPKTGRAYLSASADLLSIPKSRIPVAIANDTRAIAHVKRCPGDVRLPIESHHKRPYKKRWPTSPNPTFTRENRIKCHKNKRQFKCSGPTPQNEELSGGLSPSDATTTRETIVKRLQYDGLFGYSGGLTPRQNDELFGYSALKLRQNDEIFEYSTVGQFSDWINSTFGGDPRSATGAEMKRSLEDASTTRGPAKDRGMHTVDFQFQMGQKQLRDPLLSWIHTMDVSYVDGQKNGLLVAGGTSGRISVFPLPSSGSTAWRKPGAISIMEDDDQLENLQIPSYVKNPSAPLLSWAVDSSWIPQVLFLSNHFYRNDRLLLTASNNGNVVLWDINQVRLKNGALASDQEQIPRVVCQTNTLEIGSIYGMHMLDGKIAIAVEDSVGISTIGETKLSKLTLISTRHTGTIRSVKFRDNNVLADCGTDTVMGILDLRSPKTYDMSIPTDHKTGMSLVEWRPKSDYVLLSASLDPELYLFDIRKPKSYQHILQGHIHHSKCYSVYRPAFVDEGNAVVSPGEGTRQLSVYSVATGAAMSKVQVGYDTTTLHWNSRMAEGDGNLWAASTQITKFVTKWG